MTDLITAEEAADEAWLARCRAHNSPERRNRAIVKYNPDFARWQAERDPLYRALASLWRELKRPYTDVEL